MHKHMAEVYSNDSRQNSRDWATEISKIWKMSEMTMCRNQNMTNIRSWISLKYELETPYICLSCSSMDHVDGHTTGKELVCF